MITGRQKDFKFIKKKVRGILWIIKDFQQILQAFYGSLILPTHLLSGLCIKFHQINE